MTLRKGKTKSTLESSIEAAFLAVEIYNKPRTPFRTESFITLMIIAWTRLFHAHFNNTIGNKYYYKKTNNAHYQMIDGKKKSWGLKTCINKHGKITDAVKANMDFFIKLRNKIEHRYVDQDEIGVIIFGECQALMYNYENTLIDFFGEEYALNESLSFSIQFSRLRKKSLIEASKRLLSKEIKELKVFIEKYRTALSDEVFNTQGYNVKLIQAPKISNTDRNDLAIEFVNWSSLSEIDRDCSEKLLAITKDRVVIKEAINPGKRKPTEVKNKVNSEIDFEINLYDHKCLYICFQIRPPNDKKIADLLQTNTAYCCYDAVHKDYIYTDEWTKLIIRGINDGTLKKDDWRENSRTKKSMI
ncbi:MAG: DUF3644 domain-containing protein [Flavobacteriaceae bacterium]